MANELEFKIRLTETEFNNILKTMYDSNYKIQDKYQKDIIYILPKNNNDENLLRIRKEEKDTILTYKHKYFNKSTFIGCNEYEVKAISQINTTKVFLALNKEFNLNITTPNLAVNELEKYIKDTYTKLIIEENTLEKLRHEIIIFNLKDKKITLSLDNVTKLGYFLEIEYLSDEILTDEIKLEIKQFLKQLLYILFNIQTTNIVQKGYLMLLKEQN